ncbi:MAG TPA: glucose-6-phosphate isomerase [Eggerthellaceae bacterium]|nr:glucose-6-phosphate isomerase [Eggerthellaceae bacterium]
MNNEATISQLVQIKAASRVHAKDATLYSFSKEAEEYSAGFMGWADLASNPPCPVDQIKQLAAKFAAAGTESVILIGQGGSTQASMTMTKFNKEDSPIAFRVLDSDSPVRLRKMLAEIDPAKTLVIVSSKSGGTLEMRTLFSALRAEFAQVLPADELCKHFVAITDPGSALAAQAEDEGWGGVLLGEPTVGGRFSALSVFGLFPAAVSGIDIDALLARGRAAEQACSQDDADNPAIQLAAFLYDNWRDGRDKFAFVTEKRARALGLWIEQLIAESVGKGGVGVLPQVETDPLLLAEDRGDRAVVVCSAAVDTWDEADDFERSVACIHPATPFYAFSVEDVEGLAEQFVIWEYATAFLGYLMQVSPFDQPDVASVKAKVLGLFETGMPDPDFVDEGTTPLGTVEVRTSDCCAAARDVKAALRALFASIRPGDYFAMNAFLPFDGEGRREALGFIRREVALRRGVMSCLEIGPRYMHSTGQLQKGGADTGVYLLISAGEPNDIAVQGVPPTSLGHLSKAQATGDFLTLAERGRRCLHLHLPDNSTVTLRRFADLVRSAIAHLD